VNFARQFYGRGLSELRNGNDAAARGEWGEAERFWERALEQSAKNHAAHFNLALAAQSRGDYATASRHLDQAISIFGDRLYQQHRQQFQRDRAQQSAAVAQFQARNTLSVARRQIQDFHRNVGFSAPLIAAETGHRAATNARPTEASPLGEIGLDPSAARRRQGLPGESHGLPEHPAPYPPP
jgi:tetratricopeptide (TPR) repeat protein